MSVKITVDYGPDTDRHGGGDEDARRAGKVCERCDFAAHNVGPFTAGAKRWDLLCARCKCQISLTPDVVRSMESEMGAAVRAMNDDHEGEG